MIPGSGSLSSRRTSAPSRWGISPSGSRSVRTTRRSSGTSHPWWRARPTRCSRGCSRRTGGSSRTRRRHSSPASICRPRTGSTRPTTRSIRRAWTCGRTAPCLRPSRPPSCTSYGGRKRPCSCRRGSSSRRRSRSAPTAGSSTPRSRMRSGPKDSSAPRSPRWKERWPGSDRAARSRWVWSSSRRSSNKRNGRQAATP